jgi:hypothetical protein
MIWTIEEEQVSLIMALGRVVYAARSYGPPAPDEHFADTAEKLISGTEESFRENQDFDNLKISLGLIKQLAEDYTKALELSHKTRNGIEPTCPPGCYIVKGLDIDGEYQVARNAYADSLTEFWQVRTKNKDGNWRLKELI